MLMQVSENKTCALKTGWYKTGTREPVKRLRRTWQEADAPAAFSVV
jgi:hypothetical protein